MKPTPQTKSQRMAYWRKQIDSATNATDRAHARRQLRETRKQP